jgi:predicted DNA-binding transcriptional regulator YafY
MPRKRNPDSSHADKALRLFAKLFFNPRAYSLTELSEALNCSKSTVKRVIAELQESMPTPITVEQRGRQHFYSLPRRTPVPAAVQITEAEIQSLAMCRAFAEALLGRDEFDDATSALEKSIALSTDRDPPVGEEAFSALSSGRVDYTPHETTLRTLLDAIAERRVCRITHRKLTAREDREYWAKPMKIFSHQDSVYVHVLPAKEPGRPFDSDTPDRILAVHRITGVEKTDRPYRVPDDYDFERSRRGHFGVWQSRPFEVACEFRGWAADYVAEREWSNDQSVVPGADGGVELRFTARGLEEVSRWVLGFGENARVLEPPALVQHVARSLREAAARYQGEARG